MSRYYFNLEGDGSSALDLVGRDLDSDEAAKAEAARFASDFESPEELAGMLAYNWIEVTDQSQRPVARLPLSHVNDEPSRIS
jgi:hypothetical protein